MENNDQIRKIKDKIIDLMNKELLRPEEQAILIDALAVELISTAQTNNHLIAQKKYNFCNEFCVQHYKRFGFEVKFIVSNVKNSNEVKDLILVTGIGEFKVYEKELTIAKYMACKEAFKKFLPE